MQFTLKQQIGLGILIFVLDILSIMLAVLLIPMVVSPLWTIPLFLWLPVLTILSIRRMYPLLRERAIMDLREALAQEMIAAIDEHEATDADNDIGLGDLFTIDPAQDRFNSRN